MFAAFRLALFAGLRRGEVCALQWRDFDACAGTLSVHRPLCERSRKFKDTKTEAGVAGVRFQLLPRRFFAESNMVYFFPL